MYSMQQFFALMLKDTMVLLLLQRNGFLEPHDEDVYSAAEFQLGKHEAVTAGDQWL